MRSAGVLTQAEKKDRLRVKEDLEDFANKAELDAIYDDYWFRPWSTYRELRDSDLPDGWDWDEIDYKTARRYMNG